MLDMSLKLPVFTSKEPDLVHDVCIRWHVRQHVAHALLAVKTRRSLQTAGQKETVVHLVLLRHRTRPLRSNSGAVCKGTTNESTPSSVVCVNLGEAKDVIEEETTCASLLGSSPLGNDTHAGSTTKVGTGEEAGTREHKTSFLSLLGRRQKRQRDSTSNTQR